MTETTETTETTTPTPTRRRTAALWIGAACVAVMGFILGRTVWLVLISFLAICEAPEDWCVAMSSIVLLVEVLVGWWAVAKWTGSIGLCPSLSGWRRRGMELGVVAGVVAAMYLCAMALQMLFTAQLRSVWNAREMPTEDFVDPETGEPLVAHTETINVRAGFDLPSGDAATARLAWQLAADEASEAPEPPDGAPEGE